MNTPFPAQLEGAITFPCNGKIPAVVGWQDLTESVPHTGNYGVQCGARSGIFVLDFDDLDALEAMEKDPARPLPRTFEVETARGVHLYYRHPGGRILNSVGELADHVDVRGDGGQVIGPGSVHPSGHVYKALDNEPIADAPAWLLDWPGLRQSERAPKDASGAPDPVTGPERDRRLALFVGWLASQPPCISKEKNAAGLGGQKRIWRVALRGVRYEALPLEDVRQALRPYNARCEPPWSDNEIAHTLESARNWADGGEGMFAPDPHDGRGLDERFLALWIRKCTPRAAANASAAPHAYTFDPANVVRELQFVESEDGSKKAKKPYKPDIDEVVFDLNTETAWTGVFRYNEFDDKVYAVRPPFKMATEGGAAALPDRDLTGLRVWFLNKKLASVKEKDVASAVDLIAHRSSYHPIKDWLNSLPETSTRHLDSLASVLFGDERTIAQEYVRKQLIAAVARIFEPGCRVDTVLTLVGPRGGQKKSTAIEELHEVPGCYCFRTDLPDLRDLQKVGQALEGVWVAELAELAVTKKGDVETVKATLTRRAERYSPKWVKGEVTRPRGCVFWASTNDEQFLPKTDPALCRRFWPVHAHKRVDTAWLAAHRAEIWSEAVALYVAGQPWWFEDETIADEGRAEFLETDPMEQMVREALDKLAPLEQGQNVRFVTATDVYRLVHPLDARPPTLADSRRIAGLMRGMGYKADRTKHEKGFAVPVKGSELGKLIHLPISPRVTASDKKG